MNKTTKEFLEKLAALLEDYQVEITIEESCRGWSGYTADGIELNVAYVTEDGYKLNEYVSLRGTWFTYRDFKEALEDD